MKKRTKFAAGRVLPRVLSLGLALLAGCGEAAVDPSTLEIGGLDEIEQALAEQRGHPVLLNFWATWCPPCVAEMPDLTAVVREYEGRGARALGVSYDLMTPGVGFDEAREKVRTFLDGRDLELPTVILTESDLERVDRRFELPGGIPVTLAYDRDGNLVDRHDGAGTRERFVEMMEKALGS